jgi:hypothetical protein
MGDAAFSLPMKTSRHRRQESHVGIDEEKHPVRVDAGEFRRLFVPAEGIDWRPKTVFPVMKE